MGTSIFLSITLSFIGGGFLWSGKKNSNPKLMIIGGILLVLSYFTF